MICTVYCIFPSDCHNEKIPIELTFG
uniref:Uncharacterized protein n=1 Tax=Rhizophora mucronata TaxID=61149 RepID=A0A2P2Q9Q2_RHIMU